jgi:hypothetical protein
VRAGLLASALAAAAQAGPVHGETPGEQCELHVWASPGLGMTLNTLWDNFAPGINANDGLVGAVVGSPESRLANSQKEARALRAPASAPLGNAQQLTVLQGLELPALLGVAHYRPVYHPQTLGNAELRSAARYGQSTARCYADLVLSDVVYSREHANGQNLKSYFRFRDFSEDAQPQRRLSTWVQTKLVHPREGKKANPEASDAELPAALAGNARKFAEYLAKAK